MRPVGGGGRSQFRGEKQEAINSAIEAPRWSIDLEFYHFLFLTWKHRQFLRVATEFLISGDHQQNEQRVLKQIQTDF